MAELDYGEDPADIMTDLDGIRVNEVRVPDGTRAVDGQGFRYCFVSSCDGKGYVPVGRYLSAAAEIERLRAEVERLNDAANNEWAFGAKERAERES